MSFEEIPITKRLGIFLEEEERRNQVKKINNEKYQKIFDEECIKFINSDEFLKNYIKSSCFHIFSENLTKLYTSEEIDLNICKKHINWIMVIWLILVLLLYGQI